jgi:hypothetical protein
MKTTLLINLSVCSLMTMSSFSQQSMLINLHEQVQQKNMDVFNRDLSLLQEPSYEGIRLNKSTGEGIAWLKGVIFSNGIVDFDVRGEDVKQHSFVGIAFHGKDNETFDAIYLRPFQFRAKEEVLRNRSIQYISLPEFTWQKLREDTPGKYEQAVKPSPDPNAWVHMRVVIQGDSVSTYINNSVQPCLVVKLLSSFKSGSIGFYVADTSGGDFANLRITKTD